jgi:hypothetical protein
VKAHERPKDAQHRLFTACRDDLRHAGRNLFRYARRAGARNGWTFWHVETKKGLKLIAEIRSGMATG